MWQVDFLAAPEVLPKLDHGLRVNEDMLRWKVFKKQQHPVQPNTHRVRKMVHKLLQMEGHDELTRKIARVAPH